MLKAYIKEQLGAEPARPRLVVVGGTDVKKKTRQPVNAVQKLTPRQWMRMAATR